ncbi:MAG: TonB-dependent receptor, partial [Bacteroidota bacterium]
IMKNTRAFLHPFIFRVLVVFSGALSAQTLTQTIRGQVIDTETNSPLPGATLIIMGTNPTIATTTDIDGQYSLMAGAEDLLVISYIGFVTKEVPIAGQSIIDVMLEENISSLEEIVVVGSRSQGRTKLETPAPVDIINVKDVAAISPQVDLAQLLVATAPSFNAVRSQGGDLSSHVDPPTLRGLAPNQMLVLINGKRRHTSALLNASQTGTFANAVDMSFIPAASVERVEILRDGAAAQYGSDAIAGVMNIVLKESVGKLTGNLTVGAFPNSGTPKFENDYGGLTAGEQLLQSEIPGGVDGESYQFDANYGIKLGNDGFLSITGLLRQDRPAVRATVLDYARYQTFNNSYLTNQRTGPNGNPIVTNPELLIALSEGSYNGFSAEQLSTNVGLMQARGISQYDVASYQGQPAVNMGSLSFNMGSSLSPDFEFYAYGDIGFKKIEGFSCFYRSPSWNSRAGAVGLYPNGFRPQMVTNQANTSFTTGVSGKAGDYSIDVSNTFGRNAMDISMINTINVTFGDLSPVEMDLGNHAFWQNTTNVDISRFHSDVLQGLNVGAGVEMRVENYQINAGQPESYENSDQAGVYYATLLDERLVGPDGMPIEDAGSSPIVGDCGCAKNVSALDSDGTVVKNYSQGNQCFTGFGPQNEANEYRTVTGAYLDLELDVTDALLLAAAGRVENYSDFGSVLTGKFATRYSITDGFAIRGSYSTGFRAPSLQELNYSHTFTYFVNTIPADATIYPNRSSEARVLGVGTLKEETSENISLGFAAELFRGFNLTVDAYKITIEDRIFQTDPFTAADAPALQPLIGDGEAQFRINGGTISSRGIEVVGNYGLPLGNGDLGITIAGTFRENTFEEATVPDLNTVLTDEELAEKYVQRGSIAQFETGTPTTRLIGTVNYSIGKWGLMIRPTYYGEVTSRQNDMSNIVDVSGDYDIFTETVPNLLDENGDPVVDYADQVYSPEVVVDLGVSYTFNENISLTIGGNNVLNNLPDIIRYENRDFGLYSNYQQGSGGAYYFGRLGFSF